MSKIVDVGNRVSNGRGDRGNCSSAKKQQIETRAYLTDSLSLGEQKTDKRERGGKWDSNLRLVFVVWKEEPLKCKQCWHLWIRCGSRGRENEFAATGVRNNQTVAFFLTRAIFSSHLPPDSPSFCTRFRVFVLPYINHHCLSLVFFLPVLFAFVASSFSLLSFV